MAEKSRATPDAAPKETLHTPGGMTTPPSATGDSADGADIASTDTSAFMPNSTSEPVPPPMPGGGGGGGGAVAEPPEGAIRRLEGELDDMRDRTARLAAEFDNFRKRTARERIELNDRAQAALVIRLLDVLDDLDRITELDAAATPGPAIAEAIEMVDRKLRKELEGAGVERLDPVGKVFDPHHHEAVAILPPSDPAQDHTVSATFQVGYLFKGNLVRPARVQVYSSEGHA